MGTHGGPGAGHAGRVLGRMSEHDEDEPRVTRRPRRNMRRLLPYFRPYRTRVVWTIILMLVVTATGLAALRVPEGFQVTLAAGPELAPYAMFGALDERGRLFLAESSGKNIRGLAMSQTPECRIRRLTDTHGNGVFDQSTIFVDRVGIPMGVLWHDGALFVASPPGAAPEPSARLASLRRSSARMRSSSRRWLNGLLM